VNKELTKSGADASSEGVQRDLLPLIEGSAIDVKIQDKTLRVNTEHILFICAGAFSQSKPTDLLAEFLGRLPIRVQLQALTADDFYKILTETKITLPSQHKALLKTEGVNLQFTDESLHEIARYTALGNKIIENIGARRLHTVIEKVVDDISYNASEEEPGTMILVDAKLVKEKVGVALEEQSDFSRFIM
jgi:ATP-dependent HslUV protease ATP-binding subunit HslU